MTPWTYQGQTVSWTWEHICLQHWIGFTYMITCVVESRRYIGSKQFASLRFRGGPKASKVESAWRVYWGSSKPLTEDLIRLGSTHFTAEILTLEHSLCALHYAEQRLLFTHDVLRAKNSKGGPAFYNQAIWGHTFRRGQPGLEPRD